MHKTLLLIEHIREVQWGLGVGEGADSTYIETEGGLHKLRDLPNYLDDPDNTKYYKLK